MKKTLTKINDFKNLLETIVNSTHMGTNKTLIQGNKDLELERAMSIKNIEDTIEELMLDNGEVYIRKYEHMYNNL